MERFTVTDDLVTGIPEIDDQHRVLFAWADRVLHEELAGPPILADRAIRFLSSYVGYHFAAEEHAMARVDYDAKAGHILQHRAMTRELQSLQDAVGTRGLTPDLRVRVHFLFRDWLRLHIRETDRRMASFLAANPDPAGGPALPDPDTLRKAGVDLAPNLDPPG